VFVRATSSIPIGSRPGSSIRVFYRPGVHCHEQRGTFDCCLNEALPSLSSPLSRRTSRATAISLSRPCYRRPVRARAGYHQLYAGDCAAAMSRGPDQPPGPSIPQNPPSRQWRSRFLPRLEPPTASPVSPIAPRRLQSSHALSTFSNALLQVSVN
jgi:hypothetical protein